MTKFDREDYKLSHMHTAHASYVHVPAISCGPVDKRCSMVGLPLHNTDTFIPMKARFPPNLTSPCRVRSIHQMLNGALNRDRSCLFYRSIGFESLQGGKGCVRYEEYAAATKNESQLALSMLIIHICPGIIPTLPRSLLNGP